MSGIEIAGLVLGAFPLAIECIKAYSEAIKDMRNYQQILRNFVRELKVEKCKYKNSLLELLTELAAPVQIKRMMTDLHADEWDDEDFRSRLRSRLRPADDTLENWLGVANELNETLKMVIERFKLPRLENVQQTWRNPAGASEKFDPCLAWEVGVLNSYRTEKMTHIRQLNSDLRELATGVKNSTSEPSSSHTTKVNKSVITYHKRIQRHAGLLYSLLNEKLEPPMYGHEFTLIWREFQLEPIIDMEYLDNDLNSERLEELKIEPSSEQIALPSSPSSNSPSLAASKRPERSHSMTERSRDCTKHFLTPTLKKWKGRLSRSPSPCPVQEKPATTISQPYAIRSKKRVVFAGDCEGSGENQANNTSSHDNTTSRPCGTPAHKRARFADNLESGEDNKLSNNPLDISNNKQVPTISCFCTTLMAYTTIHHPITSPKCIGTLISMDKTEHLVWTPSRILPNPARLVSLADLITALTNFNAPSRKSRLILSLKLISSVLQLSTTQWLTEMWGVKDILFPATDQQITSHNVLSRPFVHRNFNNYNSAAPLIPERQSDNQDMKDVIGCNQYLYSLGIVLLEIWYWQTFISMHKSSANGLPEVLFAYQLSNRLFDEAGEPYAMAVRRCVRGLDMRGNDLEEDSFRTRVYQDVFLLLEAALKHFSGSGNIQKILEGE